jgi:sodium transport system permease protein
VRLTPAVRAIFGLEMKTLLRDPRTVFISIVLPVLLIPVLLLLGGWAEDRRTEREDTRTYRLAITGSDSTFALGLLEGILTGSGENAAEARFRRVSFEDGRRALEQDSLDVLLETFTAEEWDAMVGEDTTMARIPSELKGARVVRLRFHSSRTASREGSTQLWSHLQERREVRRDSIVFAAGLPVHPTEVAPVETVSLASDDEVQGARMGRYLTLILLSLMVLGGSAVATDTLAGEKERGTLTTLLTAAASRAEIITGKLLAVVTVAFGIALVQVLNLWIFVGMGLIDAAEGFAVAVSPMLAAGLLVLYLPAVVLTSGILLLTSAHARSYKEAQLFLTPVLLGMLIPALAPLLPDISLRSAIVAVPLANLSIAARDLLAGQAWAPGVAVSWLVTAGAAVWVTTRSVKALYDENLMTGDTSRAEFEGGPALFQRRVLIWFLVFWAVKVLLDFNLVFDDIRTAALVGVGVVFLAFPLLVVWRFRLDPRQALALRAPKPGVWLGVLLGAPAGILAAHTVFRLMDFVVPVPHELLEQFGQAIVPEGVPLWQLVLLLAVIPGITEELTFRGVLLHGLRRRFGPVGLTLVVGLIFGFFHFQIFRIPATAVLGVILTAVTLMTGSIFPAMVWHALNNALALVLTTAGVDMVTEGWGLGAFSFLALGVALWMIWRHRTPYPGVGPTTDRPPERRPLEGSAATGSRVPPPRSTA